jgi:PTS system mannose-specific IIC component
MELLWGALVAWGCGLDRVAVGQFLLSRPLVAAPLTGLLLGDPLVGLQIGVLIELLWLGRLPVGAAVPPDDTQVAIAATVMTLFLGRTLNAAGHELLLLCVLMALPLGKVGQFSERYARHYNMRLVDRVEQALEQGTVGLAERQHLWGLLSFSLAALVSYGVILAGGLVLVPLAWPLLQPILNHSSDWLALALPLVGIAVVLGTINVSRAITLFCAAFVMAFLLLWLV